jgi:succinyl-diaminopimelate desuccinylase
MHTPSYNNSETIKLACDLIKLKSVTPEDAGCQKLMINRLESAGFKTQNLPYDDVKNFWAVHGEKGPTLCFAGHTDVVPAGDENFWSHPPFQPTLDGDFLYGRGAADMKGSLAAMITATERFISAYPEHKGRVAFLITSDEEGPALNGTVKAVEYLKSQNEIPEWCLIGEPSSSVITGDIIKNGRRGSLNGELTVRGIQGHVAYPQTADNPIHKISPALDDLAKEHWDDGNSFFPATTFQISNINAGTGATNVIPGEAKVVFNFRFSTEITEDEIKNRTEKILQKNHVDYEIKWILSGKPFITEEGELINAAKESIFEVAGLKTQLSTAGGTSDGRFIAPYGSQVLELGPVNATIHKIDECANIKELDCLSYIYQRVLEKLLV